MRRGPGQGDLGMRAGDRSRLVLSCSSVALMKKHTALLAPERGGSLPAALGSVINGVAFRVCPGAGLAGVEGGKRLLVGTQPYPATRGP